MKYIEKIALIIVGIGFTILMSFLAKIYPEHINFIGVVSLEKASKLGDFAGGFIGVLFSLAGFFLLYATLNLQRKEISSNRELIEKQSFEGYFFQFVMIHNELVKSFDIRHDVYDDKTNELLRSEPLYTGRDSFKYVLSTELKQKAIELGICNNIENLKILFEELLCKWDDDLTHYFTNSIELIKYIYSTKTKFEIVSIDRRMYIDIFMSNFSTSENLLLFYYVFFMCDDSVKKTVCSLGVFKKLKKSSLLSEDHYDWINNFLHE